MQFYRLKQPKLDSPEGLQAATDSVKEEGNNNGESVRCPTCNRPLSMLKWLPPFRIELESWGKHYGDVAEIGDDVIVSERFMQIFTSSGLQGFERFEPVTIIKVVHRRGKPKESLPRYFKAAVIRSTTTIDQEASAYVWEDKSKVCPECLFGTLKRHQALVIKEETWTGDDIFFPRGGNGPIVSERFKNVFDENRLLGAVFIPVEEAGYDNFPWETQSASTA